jgi:hypothetical protein
MKTKFDLIYGIITAIIIFATMTCAPKAMALGTTNSNEFWISTNAATANIGTLNDPLDGSTQAKFDAAMNGIPPNSTIHILAGTYQTLGNDAYGGNGWFLKTGQKILGSGVDVTILQLVHGAPDQSTILEAGNVVTNVEISDLTCDGNYTSGSYTYLGVYLDGTDNAARRIKVINLAKFGGNSEAWGIELANYSLPYSKGNIIEECEVSHFAGPVGGAISSIVIGGNATGIMRNNRVLLPNDGNQNAFSFNGNDVLIEGNYVNGAAVGVYGESDYPGNNITIVNNTFRNCLFGVFANGAVRNNITIAYNNILLATNSTIYGHNDAILFYDSGSTPSTNVNIIGNHVGMNAAPLAGINYFFLNMFNVKGFNVANNTVDTNIINYVDASCTNVRIDNNCDSFGNYLTSLNIPMLGNTPVTSLGLNLIGSAGISPALAVLGLPSNPLVLVTNNSTGLNLSGTFSGSGSGLTGLNASQLTSGTVPLVQLPNAVVTNNATGLTLGGTFSGNGAGLTSLNASQLTSGTVPLAQLLSAVVTNNATGLTLSGTFNGNGGGLTNIGDSSISSSAGIQLSKLNMPTNMIVYGSNNVAAAAFLGPNFVIQNYTNVTSGVTNTGNTLLPTSFTSQEYALPAVGVGGVVANVAHGLSKTPTVLRWVILCKTNNLGYNVGDEVDVNSVLCGNAALSASQPWVFSNGVNATNVFLIMNNSGTPQIINKTNFNNASLPVASWKAKCYARP